MHAHCGVLFAFVMGVAVLRAMCYEVHFQEFEGGRDCLSWPGTLADGPFALLGADATR